MTLATGHRNTHDAIPSARANTSTDRTANTHTITTTIHITANTPSLTLIPILPLSLVCVCSRIRSQGRLEINVKSRCACL